MTDVTNSGSLLPIKISEIKHPDGRIAYVVDRGLTCATAIEDPNSHNPYYLVILCTKDDTGKYEVTLIVKDWISARALALTLAKQGAILVPESYHHTAPDGTITN